MQRAAGPETEILAVVKANAYGHGVTVCAPILARAGARWLGVTCASEGLTVRKALRAEGFGDKQVDILIMCGFLPEDVAMIVENGLTPVVWTAEQIEWLHIQKGLRVHVEVDTGMGRQGVLPGEPLDILLAQIASAGLVLDGIFTHFSSSEVADSEVTRRQEKEFGAAVARVFAAGARPEWVHAGNSSTVDNPAQEWPWLVKLAKSAGARAIVRTGLALYGYVLSIEGDASPQVRSDLQPVMVWKSCVLSVRELAVGETVGYNAQYKALTPMRVALLPVGYADGLRRELSSTNDKAGGWVMVGGRRAPILGRVSMNLTVVDISEGNGGHWRVNSGDLAVILGPGITADDHARLAGTIAYEIVCGVHPCG